MKIVFFLKRFSVIVCTIAMIVLAFTSNVLAAEPQVIGGKIYRFDAKQDYTEATLNSAELLEESGLGNLTLEGVSDYKEGAKNGLTSYQTADNKMDLRYQFDYGTLGQEETEWHLVEDKVSQVYGEKLPHDVLKGAVIVQISLDQTQWTTEFVKTDFFKESTDSSEVLFHPNDLQLQNGVYVRVIVTYKLGKKVSEGASWNPLDHGKFEYLRQMEVYNFHLENQEAAGQTLKASDSPRRELGRKEGRVKDKGYSTVREMDKNDPHYSWDLGTFVVNGYTRETEDSGVPVFLKNVGDKVSLWFTLKQNIEKLNGDEHLKISNDRDGYDQLFEVKQTDFKQGALIIRYTDHQGNVHDPILYRDFLRANARTGADTRVQLFEEGDYEVALDYELEHAPTQLGSVKVLPGYSNYQILFRFKIRNGNSMVFPISLDNGSEISDYSIVNDGFRLDMARSRYLSIDVTKSEVKTNDNGVLVEDTRFSRPAKDNDSYTEEGIYTFTVRNQYTGGEPLTKTVFVGKNKYLKALSKYKLTVDGLNQHLTKGETVTEEGDLTDGTRTLTEDSIKSEQQVVLTSESSLMSVNLENSDSNEARKVDTTATTSQSSSSTSLPLIVLVVLGVGAATAYYRFIYLKNKKVTKEGE